MQKMQILRNLKAIDCCKIPLNGNFIYFPTWKMQKKSGQLEMTRSLQSCASRENTGMIAISCLLSYRIPSTFEPSHEIMVFNSFFKRACAAIQLG